MRASPLTYVFQIPQHGIAHFLHSTIAGLIHKSGIPNLKYLRVWRLIEETSIGHFVPVLIAERILDSTCIPTGAVKCHDVGV
jgi:hypothetical protein